MNTQFDPNKPLPQLINPIGISNYGVCGEMDISQEIIKIDGTYYLANNGTGEYGAPQISEWQVQKKITHCTGCGEKLNF